MAISGQMRRVAQQDPSQFDPRKLTKPGTDKMQELCESRFDAFGTAGNASKIKPISLDDMTKRYENGELEQK